MLGDCNGGYISSFLFPVFVSCLLYIMYFTNVVSWSHIVGRGDHSSSGLLKEKAQKNDASEAQGAWLAQGHHRGLQCLGRNWACTQGQRGSFHSAQAQITKDQRRLCICSCWERHWVKTGSACRDTAGEEELYINPLVFYSVYPVIYFKS